MKSTSGKAWNSFVVQLTQPLWSKVILYKLFSSQLISNAKNIVTHSFFNMSWIVSNKRSRSSPSSKNEWLSENFCSSIELRCSYLETVVVFSDSFRKREEAGNAGAEHGDSVSSSTGVRALFRLPSLLVLRRSVGCLFHVQLRWM